jgi:hypothetical protein
VGPSFAETGRGALETIPAAPARVKMQKTIAMGAKHGTFAESSNVCKCRLATDKIFICRCSKWKGKSTIEHES